MNNPLFYNDPTGMFVWSDALGGTATDDELAQQLLTAISEGNRGEMGRVGDILNKRASIVSSMQSALKAAESPLLSPAERQKIKDSINAYGKAGVDNGVTVGLTDDNTIGGFTQVEGKQVIVAFNPNDIDAANVAHEGSHARQGLEFVKTGKNVSLFQTEEEAYTVGALTSVGLAYENESKISGPKYAPNGNTIWSVTFLQPGLNPLADAKAQIAPNVVTHLTKNGITSTSKKGTQRAFPGLPAKWR